MLITYILVGLLSAMRIAGVTHPAFQAVAHLYVGGLIGTAVGSWTRKPLYPAIILSVVETLCAIFLRK